MEPTADIDLSPSSTTRERVERVISLGIMIFVVAMLASLLLAYLFGFEK
jgi:hypothetical protein